MRRPRIAVAAGVLGLAIVLLQFVRPARTNPARDPSLALEAHAVVPAHVAATLRRACYDCHSSETRWPWYSNIAPVSWLLVRDVDEARGKLNFSRWGSYNGFDRADMLDEMCQLVRTGEMPLPPYRLMHRDAKLSAMDIEALCVWTRAEGARLTDPAAPDGTRQQE